MEERVQRRLAAILAADVVGYSALMEHAEEATYAEIGRLRSEIIQPQLTRHQGRLIKTTGDGILAEFASPVSAVRCAADIQGHLIEEGSPMQLRIGINLGDVIVADDGDVYGDGINVAARLEALADPGGILISAKVHGEVVGRVDFRFEDRGERPLKNISKPVRSYAIARRGEPEQAADPSRSPAALPLPDKPSIAVLPFNNMSGDPEQEYFADGIVEDIITALSRFKSLFVIARNSSFTYKGKAVDVKQVGQQLGVRYVLEGSVRKAASRVRITGQLIEAATNNHLWADKFDGLIEDIFSLQDQVTEAVVALIAPAVVRAEIERAKRKPTDRLDSYDLYLRGLALVQSGSFNKARTFLRKAIEQDAECGPAYAQLALTYNIQQAVSGTTLSAEERSEAIQLANAAAKLAADDAFSLAVAGHVLTYIGRSYDRGLSMAAEAVALNANLATAWGSYGWVALMCDEPEKAVESFDRLLRISPLDPTRRWAWNGKAFALFCLGHYVEGCQWAEKAVQSHADAHSLGALIMNSIGAGRSDEARRAVTYLLQLRPDFRASDSYENYPIRSTVTRDRIYQVLQAAGLPP